MQAQDWLYAAGILPAELPFVIPAALQTEIQLMYIFSGVQIFEGWTIQGNYKDSVNIEMLNGQVLVLPPR